MKDWGPYNPGVKPNNYLLGAKTPKPMYGERYVAQKGSKHEESLSTGQ